MWCGVVWCVERRRGKQDARSKNGSTASQPSTASLSDSGQVSSQAVRPTPPSRNRLSRVEARPASRVERQPASRVARRLDKQIASQSAIRCGPGWLAVCSCCTLRFDWHRAAGCRGRELFAARVRGCSGLAAVCCHSRRCLFASISTAVLVSSRAWLPLSDAAASTPCTVHLPSSTTARLCHFPSRHCDHLLISSSIHSYLARSEQPSSFPVLSQSSTTS